MQEDTPRQALEQRLDRLARGTIAAAQECRRQGLDELACDLELVWHAVRPMSSELALRTRPRSRGLSPQLPGLQTGRMAA